MDLSGAFRFREGATFARWYQLPAPDAAVLAEAVYGLPELYGDALPGARLVANPGCYPTSVILGLRPLVEAGWIAQRAGSCVRLQVGRHRGPARSPSAKCTLSKWTKIFAPTDCSRTGTRPKSPNIWGSGAGDVMFSTHLLPVARGILSTLYVWLDAPREAAEIEALYRRFYAGKPMVRLWPAGALPELQHVAHTNFCDIGFALDAGGQRLVVVSCLDNLGKGAAGQAVQNMNGMMGFEETAGLR